jgi:hypothetical protein
LQVTQTSGQEVHLNAPQAMPFARFATPTLGIETKSSDPETAHLGLWW